MAAEYVEVTGMVLMASPMKEYDKRIELLTRERGRISAFATGARKVNNPLSACTVPFTFGTYKLYEGRTSYTIHSAQIKTFFSEIADDFDALCYASYFAELARYFTRENMDASQELLLLYVTCSAMTKRKVSLPLIRSIFEMRMMLIEGEALELFQCLSCGKRESVFDIYFSKGGLICPDCAKKLKDYEKKDRLHISRDALYTLQYILTSALEKLYMFRVSDEIERELADFMRNYLSKYVHCEFNSLHFLENPD